MTAHLPAMAWDGSTHGLGNAPCSSHGNVPLTTRQVAQAEPLKMPRHSATTHPPVLDAGPHNSRPCHRLLTARLHCAQRYCTRPSPPASRAGPALAPIPPDPPSVAMTLHLSCSLHPGHGFPHITLSSTYLAPSHPDSLTPLAPCIQQKHHGCIAPSPTWIIAKL
jgi:hypothetical protein